MTLLEMLKRVRQETGYAQSGPASVSGLSGMHQRALDWLIDEYIELQNSHDWRWMRKSFQVVTAADDDSYAYGDATEALSGDPISRFKRWHISNPYNPPKCYLQSSGAGGEYWLTYIDWPTFRTLYQIGTQTTGAPSHITIDPDDNLVLGPTPNDTYVISGEFMRSAQRLVQGSDEPEMPSEYHMYLVYKAMEQLGYYEVAEEMISRGQSKAKKLKTQLMRTQLPMIRKRGPMA